MTFRKTIFWLHLLAGLIAGLSIAIMCFTGTTLAFEKELIAYCKSQLADVKCPRSIDFRVELPRDPTGKLYKRLLKDEYWKDAGRTI